MSLSNQPKRKTISPHVLQIQVVRKLYVPDLTVAVTTVTVNPLPHSCAGWLRVLFGADGVHIVLTAALLVAPQNVPHIPQTAVLYCNFRCYGSLHLCRPRFGAKGQIHL